MIRVEKVILPAFLASALVNGDTSSFDVSDNADEDIAWLERVERWVSPGHVVDMEGEPFFSSIVVAGVPFVGDVAEYVVYYTKE